MSRPRKQTVDYFPHDAHASEGDTLTVLQNRFGNNGYAFWFKLLERLSASEGHFIDCRNSTKWQIFIAKMGVEEFLGLEILLLLVEMQAIDGELWAAKVIWCDKLVENLSHVYKNRNVPMPNKPILMSDNSISTSDNPMTSAKSSISTPDNPHSIVNEMKESKGKKVNETNEPPSPSSLSSPFQKTQDERDDFLLKFPQPEKLSPANQLRRSQLLARQKEIT